MTRDAKQGTGSSIGKIADALEEDILFGRLRPRERLVEDDLIDRFKATRHHIRQALVELERMGIAVRIPNKGAVVRDFTLDEIEQICAVRELLHAKAASMIPLPSDPALVSKLETLYRAHAAAIERNEPRQIHQINNQFHETLFLACGNAYLARTISEYARLSLAFRCHVMMNPRLAAKARDEHAAMIDALKYGDRKMLIQLCVGHTRMSQAFYMELQGWAPRKRERVARAGR